MLVGTYDVAGDGPTRAIEAYQWSVAPWLPTSGVWPPGFLLLHGPANWFFPAPVVVSRIVNVALGTLTVPVFYLLVRRAFGSRAALVAAWALALWPLHIELSASSLAEAAFLFEIFTGLLLFDIGLDRRRTLALAAGVFCLVWASMTRYEMWWFLPVIPTYALWRRQDVRIAAGLAAALAMFPAAWLVGNHIASGDALAGFSGAIHGAAVEGAVETRIRDAAAALCSLAIEETGWPIFVLLFVGCFVVAGAIRRTTGAGVLYVIVTMIFWAASLYFASLRGQSMQSRYVLLGVALVLPAMTAAFSWLPDRLCGIVVVAVLLLSFASTGRYDRHRWVTGVPPVEMQNVARWVASSPYHEAFVVLTDMSWTASYFAIFWPEAAERRAIISDWVDDSMVSFNVLDRRPALLVTRDEDRAQQSRIERVLGTPITSATLVYQSGSAKVFDISALVDAARRRHRSMRERHARLNLQNGGGTGAPMSCPPLCARPRPGLPLGLSFLPSQTHSRRRLGSRGVFQAARRTHKRRQDAVRLRRRARRWHL